MFVSTYEGAVDAKGRVSIPAAFRLALAGDSRVFLWPSLDGALCLEGGGEALMQTYKATLLKLDPQSRESRVLRHGVFTRAADLKMDETGRIKLPAPFLEHARITDRAVFAGMIDSFQVWAPEAFAAHDREMASAASDPEVLRALAEPYREVVAGGVLPAAQNAGGIG